MSVNTGLTVPARCRVIIDNDWSGDPDGLVALAHHLLSPANQVVAITSSFLAPQFGSPVSRAADGAALASQLLTEMGVAVVVAAGREQPFDEDAAAASVAPGVDAIIAEARRDDPLPLYLVCAGPLTNVATAMRLDPSIVHAFTLVWVGGSIDEEAFEYNRDTDPAAAAYVLSNPHLRLVQFPLETYGRCVVTIAELEHELGTSGRVGRWLWERFATLHLPNFVTLGETWALGDSPPVLVTALSDGSSFFAAEPVPGTPHRTVRTAVDHRLLWGDLLAKLRRHAAG